MTGPEIDMSALSGSPTADGIRVGVVVPSAQPPAWITAAVTALITAGAQVAVRIVPPPHALRPTGWQRALCALTQPRTFDDPDVPSPLPQAGVVMVEQFHDVAAVFLLGLHDTDGDVHGSAPQGVWELNIDSQSVGLQAALNDEGAVELALRRVDGDALLRPSAARVQRLSPAATRARVLWRAATLPARALQDLRLGTSDVPAVESTAARDCQAPGAVAVVAGALRLVSRGVQTSLRRRLQRNEWYVAYGIDTPCGQTPGLPDVSTMKSLAAPRDRFWADPFPVVHGDQACIFVEEWPYALDRGILAALEMNRDGSWRRLGTVLQQPWHLSHPFVFRWQGETWMMPESSAAGTLDLYRCRDYPLSWEHERVIMRDVRIVDATLHEGTDRWWLFGNIGDQRVSTHEELHLFYADSPLGPWTPHAANPIVSDPRRARPAGNLFSWDGRLCRPVQDCGVRYGRALGIHHVVELTPTRYRERELARLDPESLDAAADGAGTNRVHTLNRDGWLTVVDGHRDGWRPWT